MQCFQLIDDFYFLEISVLINSVSAVHIFMCSTFLYLRFLLVWALVLMADFILEFRFEYLWPFWLMLRSVCDSFKYQGLVCNRFLILRFFGTKILFLYQNYWERILGHGARWLIWLHSKKGNQWGKVEVENIMSAAHQ